MDLLRVGPWVLLLPLSVLAFGVLQVRNHRRESAPGVAAPSFRAPTEVAGYAGLLEVGAERLAFRLVPLHADAGRQHFEAESLRRHFSLPPGQPWRLHVKRPGPVARGEGRAESPVDLERLRVVALRGSRHELRPLDLREPGPGPHDPIGVLFAGDRLTLDGVDEGALLCWGPRPSGELELELELDDERRVTTLEPGSLAVGGAGAVLARIESPEGASR